ncbi:MAG: hypothetical protein K0S65_786 [Labilithrix sp.]|nr:hypothetical protein [Labilithrix sp.]
MTTKSFGSAVPYIAPVRAPLIAPVRVPGGHSAASRATGAPIPFVFDGRKLRLKRPDHWTLATWRAFEEEQIGAFLEGVLVTGTNGLEDLTTSDLSRLLNAVTRAVAPFV